MKKWFYILLTAFIPWAANAQEVTMAVDKNPVGQRQGLVLSIEFNERGGNVSLPANIDEFFTQTSGISSMHSQSIVNGKFSSSTQWTVRLVAKSTGTFQLEPASVELDGEVYQSNPLTITVTEQAARSNAPTTPEELAPLLTNIEVVPNKRKVYVGEPLSIQYDLYGLVVPGQPEFIERPHWEGFMTQNIENKSSNQGESVIYNSRRHTLWHLDSYILIPQRPGTFKPDALVTKIPTPVPTGQRDFFGRQITQNVDNIVTTPMPEITVLPLPSENVPASFTGAVGDYSFEVKLSRDSLNAGESTTLTLRIAGSGNVNNARLPEVNLPSQIQVFGPTESSNFVPSLHGLRGSISEEYVLVPHYRGEYKIPAMSFAFFNPRSEEYEVIQTEEISFYVDGDASPIQSTSPEDLASKGPKPNSVEQRDVDVLNEDIRWIHGENETFASHSTPFYRTVWFVGGSAVSFLFAAWVLFAGKIKTWNEKRADRFARSVRKAQGELKVASDWKSLHEAFSTFLRDGMHIPFADQIRGQLEKRLLELNIQPENAKNAHGLLAECEAGQYGTPLRSVEAVRAEMLNWIKSIES